MERVAALVEGHTEAHFIKATYANSIVQRPFPNGRDVDLSLIVESIVDSLETLGGNIKHVLILLDREGRMISAREMIDKILKGIENAVLDRKIYIGVPDRHIENWILADEKFVSVAFERPNYKYEGDGCYGKSRLEAICDHSLKGPSDKAKMLKSASAIHGGRNSPSLESLRSSIGFDWAWANK